MNKEIKSSDQSEFFTLMRDDLNEVRGDVRKIRDDVSSLVNFKTKLVTGLAIGTGLISGLWALFLKFI
jgi:hypothetical protein